MKGLEAWKSETFHTAPVAEATVPSAPNHEAFQQQQQEQLQLQTGQLLRMSSSQLEEIANFYLGVVPLEVSSGNTFNVTPIGPTSDTTMTDATPESHVVG